METIKNFNYKQKMKTLKGLLTILYNELLVHKMRYIVEISLNKRCIIPYIHNINGLCEIIDTLQRLKLITLSEKKCLTKFIINKLRWKIFWSKHGSYAWEPKKLEPRIKWVKEQIEKI